MVTPWETDKYLFPLGVFSSLMNRTSWGECIPNNDYEPWRRDHKITEIRLCEVILALGSSEFPAHSAKE